jgi:hypothetical protein
VPLLAALAAAAAAQESTPPWGFAEAAHPVCPAWAHAWAAGDAADEGLLTYGTSFAGRYAGRAVAPDARTEASSRGIGERPRRSGGTRSGAAALDALASQRRDERLALGTALRGAAGPVLAGVSAPTSTPDVYDYPGPARQADADHDVRAGVRLRAQLPLGRAVLLADVDAEPDHGGLRALGAGVAWEPVLLYAGVLGARTGPSCSGGLVLGGAAAARVVGLEAIQRARVTLPVVGAAQLGVQLGAIPEAGPRNRRPFFHSMRIELHPDDDWVVGLNRAVIFGGSATSVPVTPRTVALMLVGIPDTRGKDSDFENQVASVDVRWRTRVGSRPALVTVEYGTEDSGRAFVRVPGFRLTGEVRGSGADAGWTGLTLLWLAGSRRPHPPWYHHGALSWGWTERGLPLGSPLGGQALAALASWRSESALGGLELAAGVVWRGDENLFAPDLKGVGVRGSLAYTRSFGGWEISTSGSADGAGEVAGRWSISLLRRLARKEP